MRRCAEYDFHLQSRAEDYKEMPLKGLASKSSSSYCLFYIHNHFITSIRNQVLKGQCGRCTFNKPSRLANLHDKHFTFPVVASQ